MGIHESIIREIGQKIYVLKTTAATGGTDTSGIPPVKTVKREQIVGVLVPATEERLKELGVDLISDAVLYTSEQIALSDDVQQDQTVYEIVKEIPAPLYNIGTSYSYILRRIPDLSTDVPGDGVSAEGYALVLDLSDSMAVTDKFSGGLS